MTAITLRAQAVCRHCGHTFDLVDGEPAPHGDLRFGGCASRVVVSPKGEAAVPGGDPEPAFAAAREAARRGGWAYVAERRGGVLLVRLTCGPAPVQIFDRL